MIKVLDSWLSQLKLYRRLTGGIWVKLDGKWYEAHVLRYGDDGTRYLRVGTSSFHETYLGIQALEIYK